MTQPLTQAQRDSFRLATVALIAGIYYEIVTWSTPLMELIALVAFVFGLMGISAVIGAMLDDRVNEVFSGVFS